MHFIRWLERLEVHADIAFLVYDLLIALCISNFVEMPEPVRCVSPDLQSSLLPSSPLRLARNALGPMHATKVKSARQHRAHPKIALSAFPQRSKAQMLSWNQGSPSKKNNSNGDQVYDFYVQEVALVPHRGKQTTRYR